MITHNLLKQIIDIFPSSSGNVAENQPSNVVVQSVGNKPIGFNAVQGQSNELVHSTAAENSAGNFSMVTNYGSADGENSSADAIQLFNAVIARRSQVTRTVVHREYFNIQYCLSVTFRNSNCSYLYALLAQMIQMVYLVVI